MGREEIFIDLGGGAPKTPILYAKLAEIRIFSLRPLRRPCWMACGPLTLRNLRGEWRVAPWSMVAFGTRRCTTHTTRKVCMHLKHPSDLVRLKVDATKKQAIHGFQKELDFAKSIKQTMRGSHQILSTCHETSAHAIPPPRCCSWLCSVACCASKCCFPARCSTRAPTRAWRPASSQWRRPSEPCMRSIPTR